MTRPSWASIGLQSILLGSIMASAAPMALAQGQVVFDNRVQNVVVAPVYGPDPFNPGLSVQGNTPAGIPPGSQSYNGPLLQGTGFTAQLFGGATNLTAESLQPLLPQVFFRDGSGAGFVVAPAVAIVVPGVAEEEQAKLQLRVWDNRGGMVLDWEQAEADPGIARGVSLPFISQPLGGVFLPPPNLIGLESFNLTAAPSPGLRLEFPAVTGTNGSAFQFTFEGEPGGAYRAFGSEDFEAWTDLGLVEETDPGLFEFVDPDRASFQQRFYRIEILSEGF